MNNQNSKIWIIITAILAVLFIFFKRLSKIDFEETNFFLDNLSLINLIISILLIVGIIWMLIMFKEQLITAYWNAKSHIKQHNASKVFIAIVITIVFVISFFGTVQILGDSECASCNVYKAIGFIIIMLWTCVFLCYFIWAIYYYNLNLGKTNEEWAKIKAAKQNRSKGLEYKQEDIDEEPPYNPYKEETFGLPGGTVRGMIAFTLLFGAIAMLIVSFGMSSEIRTGSFFMDQFEFFKTAFLMMIAFYFGTRGLKYLTDKNNGDNNNNPPDNDRTSDTVEDSSDSDEPQAVG